MARLALHLLLLPLISAVQLHRGAEKKCVVFHSQHKSGGATIEQKLSRYPLKNSAVDQKFWNFCKHCKLHCDRENWDCGKQACLQTTDHFTPPHTLQVAFKGYTPLLAGSREWGSPGDGTCIWATMSREPISRLVSAYYYCKLRWDNDPLCGKGGLEASNATLLEFAKHWGNYLFRELLWFPELRALAESRDDFRHDINPEDMCKGNKSMKSRFLDPWVGYKDQLNGGDDPRTKSGRMNLEAVKTKLRNGQLYDAYGVLERYNETMALFDELMPFQATTWMFESLVHGMHGAHGSNGDRRNDEHHSTIGYKELEEQDLAMAKKSPAILDEISADIELYNHVILPLFEKKTEHLRSTLAQKMQEALSHKSRGWEYIEDRSDAEGKLSIGAPQELFADY